SVVSEQVNDATLITEVNDVVAIHRQRREVLAHRVGDAREDGSGCVQVKHKQIEIVCELSDRNFLCVDQRISCPVGTEDDRVGAGDKTRIQVVVNVVRQSPYPVAS